MPSPGRRSSRIRRHNHSCCRAERGRRRQPELVVSSDQIPEESEDSRRSRTRRERRRALESRLQEEIELEQIKTEKSTRSRVCSWAKAITGVLIALGLVFVFYVITVNIIDGSSPLDILTTSEGPPDTSSDIKNVNVKNKSNNEILNVQNNYPKNVDSNSQNNDENNPKNGGTIPSDKNNSDIKNKITKTILNTSTEHGVRSYDPGSKIPPPVDNPGEIPTPADEFGYGDDLYEATSNIVPITVMAPDDNRAYDGSRFRNHQGGSVYDLKPRVNQGILHTSYINRDAIFRDPNTSGSYRFPTYYETSASQERDSRQDSFLSHYPNLRNNLRTSSYDQNSRRTSFPSSPSLVQKGRTSFPSSPSLVQEGRTSFPSSTLLVQEVIPLRRNFDYQSYSNSATDTRRVRSGTPDYRSDISSRRLDNPRGYYRNPSGRRVDPQTQVFKGSNARGNTERNPSYIYNSDDEINYRGRNSDMYTAYSSNSRSQRPYRQHSPRNSREGVRSKYPYVPPTEYRYPGSAKSIQDIIRYMKEEENKKGRSRSSFKTARNNYRVENLKIPRNMKIPSGFAIGDQNHVVGQNFYEEDNNNFSNEDDNPLLVEDNGDIIEPDIHREIEFEDTYVKKPSFPTHSEHENTNHRSNGPVEDYGDRINNKYGDYEDRRNTRYKEINTNNYNSNPKFRIPIQRESHNVYVDTTILPPVKNTYHTYDREIEIDRSQPHKITLDIYPSKDGPPSSHRKLLTDVSFNDDYDDRFSRGRESQQREVDYYSSKEGDNKEQIILHINLFSKPRHESKNPRYSRLQSDSKDVVSVQIPLSGDVSTLDVYRKIISQAKVNPLVTAQKLEVSGKPTLGSTEDVQIELIDVERDPLLYTAIEEGLLKLNSYLPDVNKVIFSEKMTTDNLPVDREGT